VTFSAPRNWEWTCTSLSEMLHAKRAACSGLRWQPWCPPSPVGPEIWRVCERKWMVSDPKDADTWYLMMFWDVRCQTVPCDELF
jgi:hypothetical protein